MQHIVRVLSAYLIPASPKNTLRPLHREKKTPALVAELGIPPESAAVSVKAAKDALLKVMPDSKAKAVSASDLFEDAGVIAPTTGYRALTALCEEGKIKRIGKPRKGHSSVYFLSDSWRQGIPFQPDDEKELQKHAREVAEASRCKGHPKHY